MGFYFFTQSLNSELCSIKYKCWLFILHKYLKYKKDINTPCLAASSYQGQNMFNKTQEIQCFIWSHFTISVSLVNVSSRHEVSYMNNTLPAFINPSST